MFVTPQFPQAQFVPQGAIGDVISQLSPIIGNAVGGTPGQVISTVGGLGHLLPFQAGPQYAPQGLFGGALGSALGGALGGAFGNSGLGSTIGGIAGGFLPFQAGGGLQQQQPLLH